MSKSSRIFWTRAAPSIGAKSIDIIASATVPAKKRSKAPPKVYAPHEHFGSPLNVCRICGEKYSYVPRPVPPAGSTPSPAAK